MNFYFFRYFFSYIFKARSRQKLLAIAIIGLFLSSFSLLVLQGIMGGLQKGLIQKSKEVQGHYLYEIKSHDAEAALFHILDKNNIKYSREYEVELLAKNDQYLTGIILHGIDYNFFTPPFLEGKNTKGIILGSDLASTLNAYAGTALQFMTPSSVDSILGDVPRSSQEKVSDFYLSELSEIDSVHAWVRISFLQNLMRKKVVNKVRIFSVFDFEKLNKDLAPLLHAHELRFLRWEDLNSSLYYALNLEKNMMIFLFAMMALLVSVTITSGFLLFFDKIKVDLMSLWILGQTHKKLMRLNFLMTQLISLVTCLLGIFSALIFLYLIEHYSLNIMPSFFLERKIPVNLSTSMIVISFCIPYLISSFFSYLSFSYFKKEQTSFIYLLRKSG